MKSYQLYLLSLLSSLLLGFAWFPDGFVPLIFIAFVPLLIVEKAISKNEYKYKALLLFACSYLTFFTWNIIVTWWVKNASFGGAAMAILCNALLMTIVFMLFHKTKKRVGDKFGHFIFIVFWIAWEYFHHHWDLTWPWLTLGNIFAATPNIIQWYEYTGIFGGSLWVLVVNYLIIELFFQPRIIYDVELGWQQPNNYSPISIIKNKYFIALLCIIVLPIIISAIISSSIIPTKRVRTEIVIVQPNIDPYEKFKGNYDDQVITMLQLASQKVTNKTEYLILPETALAENIWENEMEQSSAVKLLRDFIKKYPKLKIVVGASTAKIYKPGEKLSTTTRILYSGENYDAYNTALQIDSSKNVQIYHKSRLVPGVEKMPFPALFKFFENFAIDMGGTSGSLGVQDERTVFRSIDNKFSTAPVICYESIYGEFVAEYINNGAQFISIITNDGWWGDTPGYKQHLKYGALRAIETRKWIARSANTGISCFINPKGEIIQPTQWWQPAVISEEIQLSESITFYVKYGDYIAKASAIFAILFLIYSQLIRFRIVKK